MKVYIAESVSPENFYDRVWEGHFIDEFVRLMGRRAFYKIVITPQYLDAALADAAQNKCGVFHLSCHGDKSGIRLTDGTDIDWSDLADRFEKAQFSPRALVLSSCIGGHACVSKAFRDQEYKPKVLFGSEAEEPDNLAFESACIAWSLLYTELLTISPDFGRLKDVVRKLNLIMPHQFVYRRWNDETRSYRRFPALDS